MVSILVRTRTLFFIGIMAFALAITACGGKDKKAKKQAPADYGTLIEASMEAKAVAPRTVDNKEADDALAAFGFGTADTGPITWASRTGSGGNYQFTDFKMNFDDGEAIIMSALSLEGVHMEDGAPMFDTIVAADFTATNDGFHMEIEHFEIEMPAVDLAGMFWNGLNDEVTDVSKSLKHVVDYFPKIFDFQNLGNYPATMSIGKLDGYQFGHILVNNLKVETDAGGVTLQLLDAGIAKDETGYGKVVKLSSINKPDSAVKFHLGEMTMAGINTNKYKATLLMNLEQYGFLYDGKRIEPKTIQAIMTPFELAYTSSTSRDFSFEAFGIEMNAQAGSARAYRNGDDVTMLMETGPIVFTWPQTVEDKDLQEAINIFKELGYTEANLYMDMAFTNNKPQDSATLHYAKVGIENTMEFTYTFDVIGVEKLASAYADVMISMPEFDPSVEPDFQPFVDVLRTVKKLDGSFTYTDLGIIDRGFKYASEQGEFSGMSVGLLKGKAKAGVSMMPMAGQDEAQQKLLGDMAAAFTHMIDEGGSVTFDFKPKMPIDVDAIAVDIEENGEFDIDILGLTISHE